MLSLLVAAVLLAGCASTGGSQSDDAQLKTALIAYNRHDYATAVQIWRSLADKGNRHGQYNLALAYRDGEGVPQDFGEAVRLYRLAAAQGDPSAMNNLGAMYSKGLGVDVDHEEAVRWYRKAAGQYLAPGRDATNKTEQAIATARNNLAEAYRDGVGVAKDPALAFMWFRLAADVDDEHAPANLEALKKYLTSEQLARGEQMYGDWRPDTQ